jgi:dipeptidyl aminopeptidase/acylaminoacyl peptidase
MIARVAFATAAALFCLNAAQAKDYTREDLRIPANGAGARGLEAILVRPVPSARYPLVVINHGTPREASVRRTMSPTAYLPHATEFARRGWAAVILMRRG